MTVADLLERLRELPPNAEIVGQAGPDEEGDLMITLATYGFDKPEEFLRVPLRQQFIGLAHLVEKK